LPGRFAAKPPIFSLFVYYSYLQLQTAKEILAEVFGIRIFEVDEMIANRFLNCPDVVIFRNRWFNYRQHLSL